MHAHEKGCYGLGAAISFYTSWGYAVSIPLTDYRPYDILIEKNGKICKIQVKFTSYKRYGCYMVDIRNTLGRKAVSRNLMDFIFIRTPEFWYELPINVFPSSGRLSLDARYDKFIVRENKP